MDEIRVDVFDPPMCCPTGMCGPTIDPALIEIQETIKRLKREYPLAKVERHMFGRSLAGFQCNPEVMELIRKEGPGVLPLTAVNGRVVKTKGYPSYEEVRAELEGKG